MDVLQKVKNNNIIDKLIYSAKFCYGINFFI